MKLKNVKVGTRVKLKKDHLCLSSLKKGMVGTIIEDGNHAPCISWDNFKEGHNGNSCECNRIYLGLPENSVWFVNIANLEVVVPQQGTPFVGKEYTVIVEVVSTKAVKVIARSETEAVNSLKNNPTYKESNVVKVYELFDIN